MAATMKENSQLDSGYSWVIAFAATLVVFFQLGLVKVFGVFIPELVDQLGMSASAVGLSCSIWIGLRGILGPVWSALTRIVSYRKLVITGGIVSSIGLIFISLSQSPVHLGCSMVVLSIGSGLPSVAKVAVINNYFESKFGLANGIAFTGGAIGMAILAPLMEHLIETYGWRGAMLIYGAMNFNICVRGALMIQPCGKTGNPWAEDYISSKIDETDMGRTKKDETKLNRYASYFGLTLLKQHRILIVHLTAMAVHELVVSGWVLFLVSYTISSGYSSQNASYLSGLGGGGILVGRLVVGPLMDSDRISGRKMFFLLAIGGAVTMLCYPFIDTYSILAVISLLAGWCLGSTTPVFVVMLKDVLQDDCAGFTGAVGLHYMARGFGMLIGGPVTGYLYDTTGNFYSAFIALAVLEASAAAITLPTLSFVGKCGKQKLTRADRYQNARYIAERPSISRKRMSMDQGVL